MLDAQDSDLGGVKDVSVAIKTKGVPEGGNGVWSRLKWEGGVHRVQRVPVTESQGRIHTRAAGVLVLPEAEEVEVDDRPERPAHRRVPLVRARAASRSTPPTRRCGSPTCRPASWSPARTSGPSCRTGTRRCGCCAPGCSPLAQEQADAAASDARKAQVRTVDRSERIRTYNFPQNRITDHRIGYTAYNLDLALGGDLDGVLDALTEADRAARLAGETELTRR